MKRAAFALSAVLIASACSQQAPAPEDAADTPAAEATEDVAATAPTEQASPAEAAAPTVAEVPPAAPAPAPAPQVQTPAPQPAPQQASTQRDSRLVGVWVNENIINSGGSNFASYTTIMTMEVYVNGRVVQYTDSTGGGGDWSYSGGRTMDFEGEWRGDGKTFSVYGMGLTDYAPVATYEFSGNYLVTYSDMGRLIWQRRG